MESKKSQTRDRICYNCCKPFKVPSVLERRASDWLSSRHQISEQSNLAIATTGKVERTCLYGSKSLGYEDAETFSIDIEEHIENCNECRESSENYCRRCYEHAVLRRKSSLGALKALIRIYDSKEDSAARSQSEPCLSYVDCNYTSNQYFVSKSMMYINRSQGQASTESLLNDRKSIEQPEVDKNISEFRENFSSLSLREAVKSLPNLSFRQIYLLKHLYNRLFECTKDEMRLFELSIKQQAQTDLTKHEDCELLELIVLSRRHQLNFKAFAKLIGPKLINHNWTTPSYKESDKLFNDVYQILVQDLDKTKLDKQIPSLRASIH